MRRFNHRPPSWQCRQAFTLIELIVATTIFVSMMGMAALGFARISNGGNKALEILELHTKADALMRFAQEDLRLIPQATAMHLQTSVEPYTLTFMKPVNDTNPYYYHRGTTAYDLNDFELRSGIRSRLSDMVWVRWQWGSGTLKRGQSRMNASKRRYTFTYKENSIDTHADAVQLAIKKVDLDLDKPLGIQNNSVPVTVQRYYDYFEGTGSVAAIASTGASTAQPGEKIQVYKIVDNSTFSAVSDCDLFDTNVAPWKWHNAASPNYNPIYPFGDYRHVYTTLALGNNSPLSDANAYAVRNMDGNTVNKDRLNLIGADDDDGKGRLLYPNQVHSLFEGVEYVAFELLGRDGKVLTTESDRLGDGALSLDISGVGADDGDGVAVRPTHIRMSYLLHSIDRQQLDDLDIDGDGDSDEALMTGIRDLVASESHATRMERIKAFKAYALQEGYTSIYFSQSVQLGY